MKLKKLILKKDPKQKKSIKKIKIKFDIKIK
jgi:hypothetical protein